MRIIKHINNNFAIALDSIGNQIVVSGKGIGFGTLPREVDLAQISHSYYNIDPKYYAMIKDIPDEILEISSKTVDYAKTKVSVAMNASVVFTLADHIHFAINRFRNQTKISLPLLYDIENLYIQEMEAGLYALKLVRDTCHVCLPKEEAAYIALHIINAEVMAREAYYEDDVIVEEVTNLIEINLDFTVDRDNFNYARFVSHMHYLLKVSANKDIQNTDNDFLYAIVKEENPKLSGCVDVIGNYLEHKIKRKLKEEDKLYLMLHINRLYDREACNQSGQKPHA